MEKLKEIIVAITNNKLLLPNFQREFVWKRNQQKDLIASVLSNVPASSSLLVEENDFGKPKFNCIRIGRRNEKMPLKHKMPFYYILDGQQRFTTLYFSFFHVFNNNDPDVNIKLFDTVNNKLKVRWFLELKSENSYLFNYDTLIYDEDAFNKYLPDDFTDFIKDIDIKKAEIKDKASNIAVLKNYSLDDQLIPLQLFLTDDNYKIKTWLKKLQEKRVDELKRHSEYKESLIKVFKLFKIPNPDEVAEDLYNDDPKAINIFEKCMSDDLICNWYDKLFDFLKTVISDYSIKPIDNVDMLKAISTFEYI